MFEMYDADDFGRAMTTMAFYTTHSVDVLLASQVSYLIDETVKLVCVSAYALDNMQNAICQRVCVYVVR